MKGRLISGLLLLCLAWSASAQLAPTTTGSAGDPAVNASQGQVTVNLVLRRVVKEVGGAEKLDEAGTVRPGDVIEYRATYTNTGDRPVKGLVAKLPIPEGLEYLPKSAKPAVGLEAAAKDGVFAAEPLLVKQPDGKTVPREYSEYRMLRWSLGQLGAHAKAVVVARAKVEIVVPKAAPSAGASVSRAPPAAKP